MKRFFKVSTNAYDMIVSQEDGSSSCRILKEGEIEDFDYINLNDIEDDSSWDVVETTISEILQDSENELLDASDSQLLIISPSWRIVDSGFNNIEAACNWIKSNYSHKEWLESELSLCHCVVSDDGKIEFIIDQIGPFTY